MIRYTTHDHRHFQRGERVSEAWRRFSMLTSLFVCLWMCGAMTSCNDGVVTFTGGSARVHIFNAQVKAVSMDVDIDTVSRIRGMSSGTLSDDINLSSGLYHSFECYKTGDATVAGLIATQRYILGDGASYTMVVRGSNITDFIKPVLDSAMSPFPGKAAIRVINATDTVYCDVMVDSIKVNDIVADVQTASRLYAAPPGLTVVQTRDAFNNAVVDHQSYDLKAGKVYHLFVYDTQSGSTITQRVRIIEVN